MHTTLNPIRNYAKAKHSLKPDETVSDQKKNYTFEEQKPYAIFGKSVSGKSIQGQNLEQLACDTL